MKSYNLVVSEIAAKDISNIIRYVAIELHNADAANKLFDDFMSILSYIEKFPNMYPVSELFSVKKIRLAPLKHYFVAYMVDENQKQISVLRIIFGKSDYSKHDYFKIK